MARVTKLKVAVVTGASSGVGLELSKSLINIGFKVVGLARNYEKLKALQESLGEAFNFYSVDVSQSREVSMVFNQIGQKYGLISLLVNNAAVFKMKAFSECTIEDIDQIVDINLKGTLYCTHSALKWLSPGISRIINIASVAGIHGIKNQAIYCASKYGIDGFGEALNQELLEKGISLTTIFPGGIDTPLWNEEKNNPYPGKNKVNILKPKDIVSLVEYVAVLPSNVVVKTVIIFPSNEWH
jgi:uncharacterized protein